ncbi:hypothetical protein SAMN04488134_11358 [Amphibacillus marinus]|uniref:Uncharacterized protein n=1 Tax=Amphibacillus marinus TaxID=872970 RepID=A0A1H8SPA4_9BACI|nr:hypothetical protein [Amphibacillus marinus]SEO80471.1 hypothetical protein SAMN04488134_11358 [Amphibacillus marinus]
MRMNFWTQENMLEFWGYVRMLLETAGPGVMLAAAVAAVGFLIPIIINAFKKANTDDEQDYEYREY